MKDTVAPCRTCASCHIACRGRSSGCPLAAWEPHSSSTSPLKVRSLWHLQSVTIGVSRVATELEASGLPNSLTHPHSPPRYTLAPPNTHLGQDTNLGGPLIGPLVIGLTFNLLVLFCFYGGSLCCVLFSLKACFHTMCSS